LVSFFAVTRGLTAYYAAVDDIDYRILHALQHDGRMANVELAQAVSLSPSPCLARVRALEASGTVQRYVALLDAKKLGLTVSVLVQVTLERQIESALEIFERAVRERPEVMECYLMTGDADYLLRVVVPDVPAFERFILDFLSRVPGVGNIKSSFALKQVKYQTELPLPIQPPPRRRKRRM
jgi:Lrp/AsnC family transcriptional regulator, leucine-responsive regulatory protein